MANPAEEEHRFTYPDGVRRSLLSKIAEARLDLDCRTEKIGSPHGLVCKKNDNSHGRARSASPTKSCWKPFVKSTLR